jgi:hypothetical protein
MSMRIAPTHSQGTFVVNSGMPEAPSPGERAWMDEAVKSWRAVTEIVAQLATLGLQPGGNLASTIRSSPLVVPGKLMELDARLASFTDIYDRGLDVVFSDARLRAAADEARDEIDAARERQLKHKRGSDEDDKRNRRRERDAAIKEVERAVRKLREVCAR